MVLGSSIEKPASASSASAASRTQRAMGPTTSRRLERHYAGIRHKPECRLYADEPLSRRRILDRPAGLLREAEHAEIGADGGRRAGAGAARKELAAG